VFSGVQRVEEGERGVPLIFGKPTAEQLDPGLHLSPPFPIGEMVKVDATHTSLGLMTEFWPNVGANPETPIDQIMALPQISPERDGSLVTADLNIAHAQWKVDYRRVRHRMYAESILPDDEREIVSAAVKRGIVRVTAQITIDDLLKQADSDEGSIVARIKQVAQGMLDELDSGIDIDKVTLYRKTAPVTLRPAFEGVQSAVSAASQAREQAGREGDTTKREIAGGAADALVALIRLYEESIETSDASRAERVLSAIHDVMEGRAVEIEGQAYPAGLASGRVTEILAQARSQANELRESAEADLRIFRAKTDQFAANPSLMMYRDWVTAYNEFTGRDFVQTMMIPDAMGVQLIINADPEIMKRMYQDEKRRRTQEMQDQRNREIMERRFDRQEVPEVGG
jgi:regulator of protease activity HflC (stomatin/prohibitin superfamily)